MSNCTFYGKPEDCDADRARLLAEIERLRVEIERLRASPRRELVGNGGVVLAVYDPRDGTTVPASPGTSPADP